MRYLWTIMVAAALLAGTSGCQPRSATSNESTASSSKETYTCPMHPEVASAKPGNCPKCGMKLVKK